jgi:hypothetical protein
VASSTGTTLLTVGIMVSTITVRALEAAEVLFAASEAFAV